MLNFGFTEMLVIVVLAIVVVGPDRLPELMRFLGRQYGKVMRASEDLRRAFMIEADRVDNERRAAEMKKRREEARKRAAEARERARQGTEPLARDNGPGEPPGLLLDPTAHQLPLDAPVEEAVATRQDPTEVPDDEPRGEP